MFRLKDNTKRLDPACLIGEVFYPKRACNSRVRASPTQKARYAAQSRARPFNPVSEIIAQLQAVTTWSGEHRNFSRRPDCQKYNHVNAVIAS
jgi:hypothetical protein